MVGRRKNTEQGKVNGERLRAVEPRAQEHPEERHRKQPRRCGASEASGREEGGSTMVCACACTYTRGGGAAYTWRAGGVRKYTEGGGRGAATREDGKRETSEEERGGGGKGRNRGAARAQGRPCLAPAWAPAGGRCAAARNNDARTLLRSKGEAGKVWCSNNSQARGLRARTKETGRGTGVGLGSSRSGRQAAEGGCASAPHPRRDRPER